VITPWAAAFCVIGAPIGFMVVGVLLKLIRWHIGAKRPSFKPLDFWLGTIERLVAMALFVLSQEHLPWFIGAWVGLKFAANWKREKGKDAAEGSMIFLIGNVLSFGFAIGVAALAQWLS